MPGAVGGNAVQTTYLNNLWANEPGESDAQPQSWDPGIVLLYRKGQGSQAVQLTDDTVNDKDFNLVADANGQFTLVTQKQQEVQNLSAKLDALRVA